MTDMPAAYLRTSLEDFNRAHGLADQSQSIGNQRKVILEYVQDNPEFSEVQIREFIDAPDIIGLKQNPTKRASL